MAKKREIFETLTKRKLVEVSHHLGFRSWQVLSKGEIVKRLSRQRKKSTEEILDLLKINELRHICIKLNLNSGGVKKQTIIDRIIGNESSKKPKKIIPPKIKEPKAHSQPKLDKPPKPAPKTKFQKPTQPKRRGIKRNTMTTQNNDVNAELENRLWAAADKLWANTGLWSSEFSTSVLGLIFLNGKMPKIY